MQQKMSLTIFYFLQNYTVSLIQPIYLTFFLKIIQAIKKTIFKKA